MIGIINCDDDHAPETNGGLLLARQLDDVEVISARQAAFISARDYDAVIISGSEHCALDRHSWIADVQRVIRQAALYDHPLLGVCFGMQLIAHTLGGTVRRNTCDVRGYQQLALTEPLLGLDGELVVYQHHHDAVTQAPSEATVQAKTADGIQAFSMGNIVAVQFHPEVTLDVARYMADRDDLADPALGHVDESDHDATSLLEAFCVRTVPVLQES